MPKKLLRSLCPEPVADEQQVVAIDSQQDGPQTAVRRDVAWVTELETLRIQRWDMHNSTQNAVPELSSSLPASASATLQPAGNTGVTVMKWNSPSEALADRILSRVVDDDGESHQKEQLLEAWAQRSEGTHVSDYKKITAP